MGVAGQSAIGPSFTDRDLMAANALINIQIFRFLDHILRRNRVASMVGIVFAKFV
jgi:hypothetical protein